MNFTLSNCNIGFMTKITDLNYLSEWSLVGVLGETVTEKKME